MLIPILNESKILPIYGAFRLKKKRITRIRLKRFKGQASSRRELMSETHSLLYYCSGIMTISA